MDQEKDRVSNVNVALNGSMMKLITSHERAFESMRYIRHVFVCVEHIPSEQFESFSPTTDFIDWQSQVSLHAISKSKQGLNPLKGRMKET